MTEKEELLAKAREVAGRLGKASLTREEFVRESGVYATRIDRHFAAWSELCELAGLQPLRRRHGLSDAEIYEAIRLAFIANGGVCAERRLRPRLPFCTAVVGRRFGTWGAVLVALRTWLASTGADFPYLAELDRWIARSRRPAAAPAATGEAPPGRTWGQGEGLIVGEPLGFRGLMRTPTNEMGVVALFALMAEDLGFEIDALGRPFPDCRARRRIGPGRWQEVRIELEFLARNFLAHDHDPKGCDLLVCWENDWRDGCPLEVVELKAEVKKLKG